MRTFIQISLEVGHHQKKPNLRLKVHESKWTKVSTYFWSYSAHKNLEHKGMDLQILFFFFFFKLAESLVLSFKLSLVTFNTITLVSVSNKLSLETRDTKRKLPHRFYVCVCVCCLFPT